MFLMLVVPGFSPASSAFAAANQNLITMQQPWGDPIRIAGGSHVEFD
jgi:hypothetical protein